MGSVSETEVTSLFYNYKAAILLRLDLDEMGHHQPQTPAVTNNSMTEGLLNKIMVPNRAILYNFWLNWLKYRES